MKTGKEVKSAYFNEYNVVFGSVNNKNSKAVYINISAWAQPNSDEELSYSRVIRNINKNIKQTIYDLIDLDSNSIPIFHQNQDFLDEDIEKLFKIHEGTKVGIDNLIFSGMKIDEICEKSIEFLMLKGTSNFIDQHFNRVKDDYTGVIW
jgi:hypothetical protein